MKSKMGKVQALMLKLDLHCGELAELKDQIESMIEAARKPTAKEALLAPGHYFEERTVRTGKGSHNYLYERWYERDGRKLKHRSRYLGKYTEAEYAKQMGSGQPTTDE